MYSSQKTQKTSSQKQTGRAEKNTKKVKTDKKEII